jgi:hypothetical protein
MAEVLLRELPPSQMGLRMILKEYLLETGVHQRRVVAWAFRSAHLGSLDYSRVRTDGEP